MGVRMNSIQNTKLVFVGPVGAGKTTAVQTMAEAHCITTDEQASDMTLNQKAQTTVAMDYGVATGQGERRIHLYGTPGQERFSFMWDIITQGSHGVILLLDDARQNPLGDLHFYLKHHREYALSGRMVLGITKVDLSTAGPTVDDYQFELQQAGFSLPIIGADVRQHADVTNLVDLILPAVDQHEQAQKGQRVA